MPAWLRLVGNFCKTFWWILVLVLAVVLFIVGGFIIVKGKKRKASALGKESSSFVQAVAEKVSGAITDIKVEKAVISTKSDMERKELEKVREEPDGKKRREQLAAILAKGL